MIGNNPLLSGVAEIADGRWIQWSLEWSTFPNRRVLALIEKWFAADITDNLAYLEFDEIFHDRPPSIHIDSILHDSRNAVASLAICVSHFDGTIQKLTIQSADRLGSFLTPLSASSNGNNSNIVKVSSLQSSTSPLYKMRTAVGVAAKNRIITCMHWTSPSDVYYGLRGGDTLHVGIQEDEKGQGLSTVEYLYRDAFLYEVLWNGIMQADNFEKATIALHTVNVKRTQVEAERRAANRENVVIAVNSEGVLRLWNTRSRKCVMQASLQALLKDSIGIEIIEDVKIAADLSSCGKVLHIIIALNTKSRRGGDSDWHIAAFEISTENVSSTVTNVKEGSLKLQRLLSPPSCPMLEGQQPTRIVAQTLLDLQIYGYQSTTTLVAAWRWHWVESSETEDRITVTKNGLSSYVFTPLTSVSVVKASMEVMIDCDGTSSVLWGERHCVKEDLALCKLLTDRTPSISGIQTGEAMLIQKLKHAMIQRVFLPDRFSLKVVAAVLATSVPHSCKVEILFNERDGEKKKRTEVLAACVEGFMRCLGMWTSMLCSEAAADGRQQTTKDTVAMVSLLFIELCGRKAESLEGLTLGCLQRPASSASAIGVARKLECFSYVQLPTPVTAISDNVAPSSLRSAGQRALGIVTSAISASPDLCIDVDTRLRQSFQENAILDMQNLSWLSSSVTRLADAIQHISPAVIAEVQSSMPLEADKCNLWLSATFGISPDLPGCGICYPDEPSLLVIAQSSRSSMESPSSEFLEMASKMTGSHIKRMYCESRNVAVLLSLLSSTGGSLHSSTVNFIDSISLPNALFSLAYWSLLLWLDTVCGTDSQASLEAADLFDLFIFSPPEESPQGTSVLQSSRTTSLWTAFCSSSICSMEVPFTTAALQDSLDRAVTHLLKVSRPSPTNALLQYLTRATQHSAVSRLASLLLWGTKSLNCRGVKYSMGDSLSASMDRRERIQSLAEVVSIGRLQCSVALSAFLECFRQMLRGRVDVTSDDSENFTAAALQRLQRENTLSQKLVCCLEDLIIAIPSPASYYISSMSNLDGNASRAETSQEFCSAFQELLMEPTSRLPDHVDSGVTCLQKRLAVMYKSSNAFSSFVDELDGGSRNPHYGAVTACCTYPELFLHLHRIAHLSDIVQMTKRIRDVTVQPKSSDDKCYGAVLSIRANYALADAVDEVLSGMLFEQESQDSEGYTVQLHLSAEQVVCWSRIFEHAIVQHSFDEALGAIVRLIELEHSYDGIFAQRVKALLRSFGVAGWRVALGSMVLHVCTAGRLGWLCSLNDIWVKGEHISGAISKELERLSSSGNSNLDIAGSASYYECSCVYALSRQNLQEAARMSVVQMQSIDRQQSGDVFAAATPGSETGSAQIRALSVAVVALSVIEPRHAAFVLVRNRDTSIGVKRQNQFDVGEGEGGGPSDDPLLMLTAQQLSASLQLRLAVTSTTPALYGCKQATALHLSSCMKGLDEKQKLSDDYLRNPEIVSDVLSRCTGADLSTTYPSSSSSSSKQAAVVFTMASSIASELRSGTHRASSSSADHRLHSSYSPQGGRGVLQGSRTSLHPWTPLLDALALFDDSSQNWTLHRAAFEGVVEERIMEIPSALVESYRNAGGDMAFLLKLLMSHGYLLDVCRLTTSLVQSKGESINQRNSGSGSSSSSSKSKLPLPYTVIDAVITSSKNYLSHSLEHITSVELYNEHEVTRKLLRTAVTQLENAVKQHFKLLLAAEINSK